MIIFLLIVLLFIKIFLKIILHLENSKNISIHLILWEYNIYKTKKEILWVDYEFEKQ